MKQTLRLFQIGLRQIVKDGMLIVLLPTPFLAGAVFKFGVPLINRMLEEKLAFSLLPWYGLVDGFLICLTPVLVAIIFAFLLLDERSDGVSSFYQITPAGGYRYLMARIGLPMSGAFCLTVITGTAFHISPISLGVIVAGAFLSTLAGVALAMMVVAMAENRVEGLAFSKIMGISFLGLIFIWFVPSPYTYLGALFPYFGVGMLIREGMSWSTLLLGILTCCGWILLFTRRFLGRVR